MAEELPAKRPPVIVLDPLEIISRLLAGTLYIFAVLAILTWTKGLGPLYEFTGGNLDGLRGWTLTYGVAMALLAATLLIPVPGGRMLVSPLGHPASGDSPGARVCASRARSGHHRDPRASHCFHLMTGNTE